MEPFIISLAGKIISVDASFDTTRELCRDYLTQGPAEISVSVSPEDIAYERSRACREDGLERLSAQEYADSYLETLAVYRKIADVLIFQDILLFHGSAIAVDGQGYLFTAASGTGKSTHTRLWRNCFGQRAVMINDDKPLLRITPQGVWVCGTPWDGKHHLSSNAMVPLKGLCILERGGEDRIVPIPASEAMAMVLQQSHRPENPAALGQYLAVVEKLLGSVPFYRLQCTPTLHAAQVAYRGMERKEI